MKIYLIVIALLFLILALWKMGYSDWHLKRNQHNQTPKGNLTHHKDKIFLDQNGLQWEQQSTLKNKFHQPGHIVEKPNDPYPNVDVKLEFDPKNPNLKFLSKIESGGSYEAILQPDGTYLTTGLKKGTYNYGHPSGFWGIIKHTVLDVIPHFINGKYTV